MFILLIFGIIYLSPYAKYYLLVDAVMIVFSLTPIIFPNSDMTSIVNFLRYKKILKKEKVGKNN